eukprot:CAMPEP_0181178412 /NCGR_PEP_ID=MMETSP1096-20121128/5710_1 /TAXON_ID=156174 ORGANISM="Chrysochromulina ericina, Strain CCMP281" /NCGR_SAMPLE_ID=MMETSP1096 /ASSEMBLY_ACC=CAM_ASM_000453 /LENGTH=97 /DNA_ID=CAMNT_0023266687 /DNA_START=285 /DNA_END=575 /DNA_ORIENTATION=+
MTILRIDGSSTLLSMSLRIKEKQLPSRPEPPESVCFRKSKRHIVHHGSACWMLKVVIPSATGMLGKIRVLLVASVVARTSRVCPAVSVRTVLVCVCI